MRIIHISDLHIGKRLHEVSLLEDQVYILKQIEDILEKKQADALFIAGDIYDKTVPSAEAVRVFDEFLVGVTKLDIPIFMISGNHDSAERLGFGGRILSNASVYVSPVYNGSIESVSVQDMYGELSIYLLPFIKPSHVRAYHSDAEIESYTDTVRVALEDVALDACKRNIILSHQFVTGALTSDSEELLVGGSENVDVSVYDGFDYVALGHIHRAQHCVHETVRYSGTPLKYSFSEHNHTKSVTIVDLLEKGSVHISTVPLVPRRDVKILTGTYLDLMGHRDMDESYLRIVLTDEEEQLDALSKLRSVYPNIMELRYDNTRTRTVDAVIGAIEVKNKSPFELFAELFERQHGQVLSEEEERVLLETLSQVGEDR
ncbi:MAG: exonuclease SbcCD subunit D [Lachnospiraceae bacterium]